MQAVARGLVSKKKKRFVSKEHDIDLDLTYITPRLIAMGFPSVAKVRVVHNHSHWVSATLKAFPPLPGGPLPQPVACGAALLERLSPERQMQGAEATECWRISQSCPRGLWHATRGPATTRLYPATAPQVYNLCSERKYHSEDWFRHWAWFPFDDHNPCAFEVAIRFCQDLDEVSWDPRGTGAVSGF